MVSIVVHVSGNFNRSRSLLNFSASKKLMDLLSQYGQAGVEALRSSTPKDSGKTSELWSYKVMVNKNSARIDWENSHTNKGVNIALIVQLGHGTGTGGWVEGRDYINPALQPIFDEIAESVWREVSSI